MDKFVVDVKELSRLEIGLEAYLVLYCVFKKDERMLTTYTKKCKKIDTNIFSDLEGRGYVKINYEGGESVYFRSLSLTEKGNDLFSHKIITTPTLGNFDEFRACYPSSVKHGIEKRVLHSDLARCRKLYNELLGETTHEILCKCAKLYHNQQLKNNLVKPGSIMFTQALSAWLHQKNYLQYIDDINKEVDDIGNIEGGNLHAI